MNNLYEGWELSYFDKADKFRNYQFNLFKKYISGKTAEIGPGTGENIKYYHSSVSSLYLFETSKKLFEEINKKIKKYTNIYINDCDIKDSKEKFDTIIYLDVLEHIEDDQNEIFHAFHKLNVNGRLIINVPAFNILFSNFDKDVGHFRRYSKKDLLKRISTFDMRVVQLKYFDSIGFIFSLLSKITRNGKSNFGTKIKIWNFFVPISRILDKIFFHSFGKSLICVVEKTSDDNTTL